MDEFKKDSIKKVVQAGLLHDIGKSMFHPMF
jgi:HD superfamily phosphohydrolase